MCSYIYASYLNPSTNIGKTHTPTLESYHLLIVLSALFHLSLLLFELSLFFISPAKPVHIQIHVNVRTCRKHE